jgi:hypothetical protein
MAESAPKRVGLTADGKKVGADSGDAAFIYDEADADRASELLKNAASDDTNERAVRVEGTGAEPRRAAAQEGPQANGVAAGEESAAPRKR